MYPDIPRELQQGDPILASWLAEFRQAVISRTPMSSPYAMIQRNANGYTIQEPQTLGKGDDDTYHALEPIFTKTNDILSCSIVPSYIITESEIPCIPTFEGASTHDENEAGEDWEPPTKQLTNGDYFIWVEVFANKAKITVDELSGKPETQDGVRLYEVGKFTVASGNVDSYASYTPRGLEMSSTVLPFTPVFFQEEDTVKFRINKGYVIDVNSGEVEATMEEDYTPIADDKYYVKVDVSPNGDVTGAAIEQTSSPSITPFNDDQAGIYYFLLFTIKGDEATGFYVEQVIDSAITFDGRPIVSIASELDMITLSGKKTEVKGIKAYNPEPLPEGDDFQDVICEVQVNDITTDAEIQVVGKTAKPTGASGYITAEDCNGGHLFEITVLNGLVTEIDVNANIILSTDCGTDVPEP